MTSAKLGGELIAKLQAILDSHHAKTDFVSAPIEQAIVVCNSFASLSAMNEKLLARIAELEGTVRDVASEVSFVGCEGSGDEICIYDEKAREDWCPMCRIGDTVSNAARLAQSRGEPVMSGKTVTPNHTLDTGTQVFFYEQDHYYLSNFSAFSLYWKGNKFPTSEHAYQWQKFADETNPRADIRALIQHAPSAHMAFKYAEKFRDVRDPEWDSIKVETMREILRCKVAQHEYVERKLLQTGDRELIENSWRDDYWGWGLNRDGQNMLGKLWMEVRTALSQGEQPK